ncbi:MAG: DUF3772 domain-containing protein [Pseudomonadota bacterium]
MTRLRLFLLAALLALFGVLAAAQVGGPIDTAQWESLATRAEQAVGAGELSTAEFEALRREIADARAQFLDAESINASRIETLETQIEALGPEPAEGESEAPQLAERRAVLEAELNTATTPRREALAARSRANGLIAEIDTLIGERETAALLDAGPTPLNPVNWGAALTSLEAVWTELRREVRSNTQVELRQQELRDGLPLTIALALAGIILLLRGRRWMVRATAAVMTRPRPQGKLALNFLVSLGQVLVPLAGTVLLVAAILSTGVLGANGEALMRATVFTLMAGFLGAWLGGRLYPADPAVPAPFELSDERRASSRRLSVFIGLVLGLTILAETLSGLAPVAPGARGVFVLPLYLVQGYLLFRLASSLRNARKNAEEAAEDGSSALKSKILAILGNALKVIAVVGPLLAAAGYLNAAQALVVPAATTLGLLAALAALQVPVRDLWAAIRHKSYEDAGGDLVPVVITFCLVLASVPLFLLIWGLREAQLSELWTRFIDGFSLGEVRITPGAIISIVVVFAIGLIITRLIQSALRGTILPRTKMDLGARNSLTSGVGYVGIALASVIAVTAAGIDLTALAFVLSALSVGIGFGLQNVVSNFVSGIILLIERPISEGDWIEVGGHMGIVKSISVRSTRIETFAKTDVIVPNADFISGTVTNWTRGNNIGRAMMTVGVAYGTDTRRVQEILLEIARENPDVAAFPEPGVDFLGFGADSLDFRVRAILRDVTTLVKTTTEINHRINERFLEEGIEIPFAQRDIWLRNPEALPGAQASAGPQTPDAQDAAPETDETGSQE